MQDYRDQEIAPTNQSLTTIEVASDSLPMAQRAPQTVLRKAATQTIDA